MIRLPKKIEETIKRELAQEFSVIKQIFIDSPCRATQLHLIVLGVGHARKLIILRYWGDNSYSFLAGYANMQEIKKELTYQVSNLI